MFCCWWSEIPVSVQAYAVHPVDKKKFIEYLHHPGFAHAISIHGSLVGNEAISASWPRRFHQTSHGSTG